MILSEYIKGLLQSKTEEEIRLLSLTDLDSNIFSSEMYSQQSISRKVWELEDELIIDAHKFIFVVPEYNGSFPGVLKHFVDALSIRDRNRIFKNKKAGLIGVSSGRAGNLRGIDHFSTILNYLGVAVFPNLLPISVFDSLLDAEKQLTHINTQKVLDTYTTDFLKF